MENLANKLQVLFHLLTFQSKRCPFCHSLSTTYIGKNATISHVRRCNDCQLMFRWPKQSGEFNKAFYQRTYIRLALADVQLPQAEEVRLLREQGFEGHPKSLGRKLDIVKLLKPSGRLAVYGANWGYEVSQFCRAGYNAVGFEISEPRASFGSLHLGCPVFHDLKKLQSNGPYDVIFSSHVLEHLPSPGPVLSLFSTLCTENGWIVLFMPNCDGQNARRDGVRWGPFSSSLHPLSYSAPFFASALPQYGFDTVSTFSDPYDLQQIRSFASEKNPLGDELLVIAKRQAAPSANT